MPASYTHQHIADEASSRLRLYQSNSLRHAVLAGAEGPDPLFFSMLHPAGAVSAVRMARMIHTQNTDVFLLALMDACRADPLLRAYCCGFLAHYAADTLCHPFIYAHSLTASGAYSSIAHSRLEQQLDLLIFCQSGYSGEMPMPMAGFRFLNEQEQAVIACAVSEAVRITFPQHALSTARIRRCFDDAVRISHLLRLGKARSPLRALSGLHSRILLHRASADAANERHLPWRSLWEPDIVRTESFAELVDASIERAAALMVTAQDYFSGRISCEDMRTQLGDLSYSSGLPWADTCPAYAAPGVRRFG
ncbi:MAG: zinc dependent phospholipase C family protein [Clostridia bacterium]|nr:zinc dependent phospholipase C family protein [Clostridia bacterium]